VPRLTRTLCMRVDKCVRRPELLARFSGGDGTRNTLCAKLGPVLLVIDVTEDARELAAGTLTPSTAPSSCAGSAPPASPSELSASWLPSPDSSLSACAWEAASPSSSSSASACGSSIPVPSGVKPRFGDWSPRILRNSRCKKFTRSLVFPPPYVVTQS
jgi:hypothetical protein